MSQHRGRDPFLPAAVAIYLLACSAIGIAGHYEATLPQFLLGAQDWIATHQIHSTFLPVGYSLLLALAFSAGHTARAMHAGMVVENIAILLGLMLTVRSLLARVTPPRFATVVALFVGLHPELLHNITKVSDTNITALLLVVVVLALVRLGERPGWIAAVVAGLALGAAVLVRPNLGLLGLLVLWQLRHSGWARAVALTATSAITALALPLMVTAAIHGKPFFPHNGPYNTFAGANSHTAETLYNNRNAEDSVPPALADMGIHVSVDWLHPSDQPGQDDARDLKFEPLYQQQAKKFALAHPGQMVVLDAEKFVNFLRPETNRYHFNGPLNTHTIPWLALKTASALVVPWWLYVLWIQHRRRQRLASMLVVLTTLLYTLPFVLINSDPRFRMPLNVLLLADIARMLYAMRSGDGRESSVW